MRWVVLAVIAGCGGGASKPPAMATESECHAMAQHMLDVQIAARPPEQRPSLEDERTIRRKIADEFVPSCVGAVARETYDCWMRAASAAELEDCAGPAEPSSPEGEGPDRDAGTGDTGPDMEAR